MPTINRSTQKVVVILGPTATGKTKFANALARTCGGEIVSADSRQIYRGLDIGTGKDLNDYLVPYHMIDILEPNTQYSLAEYLTDANTAINDISNRGNIPFIVGGTALYLHGLLSGYQLTGGAPDLERREQLRGFSTEELNGVLRKLCPESQILQREQNNRIRLIRAIELAEGGDPEKAIEPVLPVDREFLVIGVLRSRTEVHENIKARLHQRTEQEGMLEEARRLHEAGMSFERMEFLGLEYRYMARFLQGKITREEMLTQLTAKINQFAKRQDSWFRKFERDGIDIYWIPPADLKSAQELIETFLAGQPLPPVEFRLSQSETVGQ